MKLTISCSELGDTQIVPRFHILMTTKFKEKLTTEQLMKMQ